MLDLYLDQVHEAYTRLDLAALGSLLSTSPESSSFIQLRQSLSRLGPSYRDSARSRFSSPPLRPLADYLANHLAYVRDAPLGQTPTELERRCTLLEDLYKTADRLFATSDNGWFVPTLRTLTTQLISVALAHGRASRDAKLTKAGEAARMLARPMGIAAADRSTSSSSSSSSTPMTPIPGKKMALYFLANSTFKVYFALKNLRLCDTVLNNVNNSNVQLVGGGFGKADQSGYWYYRGRINLYQRRLGFAKKDLEKSWSQCHKSSNKNARLILIYLITASIPLGYFPRPEVLQHFGLYDQFGPSLVQPLRKGNWSQVLNQLDRHKSWHLRHGNYLLLREKLEVVCWRNLARQTLLVSTNGQPLPMTGPPTLSLALLLKAANFAWKPRASSATLSRGEEEEEEFDLDDIESIAVSLMDQGYLKAYIMHSKRLLVLQKGQHFGFPPLSSIA